MRQIPSSGRRPPRRADTLPVRFAPDATIQPRLRDPRRKSAYLQSTASRVLDSDLEGGEPMLQESSDDDYRIIHDDYQPSPRDGNHAHTSRVACGCAQCINGYEPVRPRVYRENDDSDDSLPYQYYATRTRRRHKHLKHERYHAHRHYHGSDSSSDDYAEAYDFNLSRANKSPLILDSSIDSVTEVSENAPGMSEAQKVANGSKRAKTLHIFHSQYNGDGATGGLQAAQLTAMHEMHQTPQKGIQPLFRWMCVNSFHLG
jgi:hypothetical protein